MRLPKSYVITLIMVYIKDDVNYFCSVLNERERKVVVSCFVGSLICYFFVWFFGKNFVLLFKKSYMSWKKNGTVKSLRQFFSIKLSFKDYVILKVFLRFYDQIKVKTNFTFVIWNLIYKKTTSETFLKIVPSWLD